MLGDPDSCGIWAPCLTYADGLFCLDLHRREALRPHRRSRAQRARRCATSTTISSPARRIDGEWSDPVYLNSSGFDPSLFHDDDGRKYLLNMLWDHRPGQNRFAGIVLQEYSPRERKLIGERQQYLQGHAARLHRSAAPLQARRLLLPAHRRGRHGLGPCGDDGALAHADRAVRAASRHATSSRARHRPDAALQRAGHADLVETPDGETYMVYLCGRPLRNRGRCTLGRETAIQPMVWGEDGWLRTLDGDGDSRRSKSPAPAAAGAPVSGGSAAREDFDGPQLPIDFQWLRSPWPEELFSLTARPGHLRLYRPRDDRQPVPPVARRAPAAGALLQRRRPSSSSSREHFQQMAGLVCYYNSAKFHYLYVSHDETLGKHLRVMSCAARSGRSPTRSRAPIADSSRAARRTCASKWITSGCSSPIASEASDWHWLPQQFDASILSDEATAPGPPNFTGAFVGMACQDMAGTAMPADFDYFEYIDRPYHAVPFGTA